MHNQHTGGGILLLSHVGFSFMEDLVEALDARQLKSFVLTSLPEAEHRGRLDELHRQTAHVTAASEHVLTHEDVEASLEDLRRRGETVLACITVWEGYRHLMAFANELLGVSDLGEKQILELRNKLTLRNRLADAGLSRVRAAELTGETLDSYRNSASRYFVKPVSGIASYGAFPLSPRTTWADIERITADAQDDTVYASAFGDGLAFLVEDYLPGREFSFEVVVADGAAQVVAVHEKCEVTETAGTVLENACTSPPVSISAEECAAGIDWVRRMLSQLELRWGCFHIEARHHESRWDLIEINPRVGGSLISYSTKELTGGVSLLDLWIDLLLSASKADSTVAPEEFLDYVSALSFTADGETPTANATFFRVFFAEKGRIKSVRLNGDLPLEPVVAHVLLKAGDTVESTSREVFLGQLLWQYPRSESDRLFPELTRASEHAIDIQYDDQYERVLR
ncbi:ATP-grasp domain-containing protein [Streptomyces sp. A3M-1-3]|uniref:ATP-grasp domain-containing protein n=1 Tax=Streptomyces sp. A3M-1-3 TaxID=2962044 RepID=UPI0020B80725|nr:ATP-grasp domain-containing protein [Streptomyces sp. A3M-1-3]MCP3819184.1 ATP-grasp domain-containing protein [Streptomyces sp. A3M-1-3]